MLTTSVFAKYLTPDLPLRADVVAECGGDREAAVAGMADALVEALYARTPHNLLVELSLAGGGSDALYAADMVSGAMLANLIARAKKYAIKSELAGEEPGIALEHVLAALADELEQNQDLPNAANPDEWARLNGYKGERVTALRTRVR